MGFLLGFEKWDGLSNGFWKASRACKCTFQKWGEIIYPELKNWKIELNKNGTVKKKKYLHMYICWEY